VTYRLIRIRDVSDRTGLQRATIYKRVANGAFPKPVKIGSASRWVESDIQSWIEDQIMASQAA